MLGAHVITEAFHYKHVKEGCEGGWKIKRTEARGGGAVERSVSVQLETSR